MTTGQPGTNATVTNSGTSSAAVFDFTIPRGDKGESGSGAGDMLASDYDPNGTVATAGGIPDYVSSVLPTKTSELTNDGADGTSTYVEADDLYDEVCNEGESITFQASAAAPITSFELRGNTVQNGTPTPSAPVSVQTVTGENVVKINGKNLFNISAAAGRTSNGLTTTKEADGTLHIAGTATSNWADITAEQAINLKNGETYTLSASVGASITTTLYLSNPRQNVAIAAGQQSQTFVADSDKSSVHIYCSGLTSGTAYDFTISNIQIEKNSQATDFEEYQEQSYEVNLGKNLFDKDNANIFNGYLGSSVLRENASARSVYIPVEAGQTYTFSRANSTSQVNEPYYAFIANEPAEGGQYIGGRHAVGRNDLTFTGTAPAGSKYLIFHFAWGQSAETQATILSTYQFEKGSTATSYAAYFEPIELCKIDTYQDYIYKSDDKWYVRKEVGKISSYAGETISTDYISTTGSLTTGATIYYALATPTDTEITNEALIAQLEAILSQGHTYAGTNNITTVISAGNAQGELEICYTKTILPIATETSLGLVQIGSGLSITPNGVLSATGGGGGSVAWNDVTGKPTDVSYWNNDAGYITSAAIPTNVSSFTNDAGYITSAAIPTNVSAFTNDAGYITSSSIPTVNDATLTITQNGTNAGTFTANASNNATIALTDTTYSDFTGATSSVAGSNGLVPAPAAGDNVKVLSGAGTWVNQPTVPTKTSDLTNDGESGTSTYLESAALTNYTITELIYPIGSIYMSATMNSAAQVEAAFGGTWVAWGAGRVPVSVDTSDVDFTLPELTGGEKTHTLTVPEMPSHKHRQRGFYRCQGGISGGVEVRARADLTADTWDSPMESTGGGGAHNNLQPYITCYMYKRTA